MKLGAKGFITFKTDNSYLSQAFPALSVNPVDVAGAGMHSYLSITSVRYNDIFSYSLLHGFNCSRNFG